MRRDLLANLQTAAISEVRGNSRRPERVISDLRMDAGALSSPPDHPVGIRLAQRPLSASDFRTCCRLQLNRRLNHFRARFLKNVSSILLLYHRSAIGEASQEK
jgi:hypothetical protein